MNGSRRSAFQKQAVLAGVKPFRDAARGLFALALAVFVLTGLAGAQVRERDSVSDALAGHGAEMRQFGAAADPMRRPLFYDPVDIESVPAGVPCDHIVARRPEADGGRGWVVLMEQRSTPPRLLRYWLRPDTGAAGEERALAEARHFALEAAKTAEIRVIAARSFIWCR